MQYKVLPWELELPGWKGTRWPLWWLNLVLDLTHALDISKMKGSNQTLICLILLWAFKGHLDYIVSLPAWQSKSFLITQWRRNAGRLCVCAAPSTVGTLCLETAAAIKQNIFKKLGTETFSAIYKIFISSVISDLVACIFSIKCAYHISLRMGGGGGGSIEIHMSLNTRRWHFDILNLIQQSTAIAVAIRCFPTVQGKENSGIW